ncbi:SufD family Fe-S cluster assembly protein [Thermogladius sp. 4427co]|uniref:SufD family Fe-S cluster assembly protein n=1 Tax=Thermogladius sp. 4427co TaxID=3450718 RepID=UPI003F796ACA
MQELVVAGDSPTIKHYIEPRQFSDALLKYPIEDVLITIRDGGSVSKSSTLPEYQGGCVSLFCAIHSKIPRSTWLITLEEDASVIPIHVAGGSGFSASDIIIETRGSRIHVIDFSIESSGPLSLRIYLKRDKPSNTMLVFRLSRGPVSYLGVVDDYLGYEARRVVLVDSQRTLRVDEVLKASSTNLTHKIITIVRDNSTLDYYLRVETGGSSPSVKIHHLLLALEGSTGVARGVVRIREDAGDATAVYGIDSVQLGGNAFMQPSLEVSSNKVLEGRHYARNLRLSPEQGFYLASRGLDEKQAYRLLVESLARYTVGDKELEDRILDYLKPILQYL